MAGLEKATGIRCGLAERLAQATRVWGGEVTWQRRISGWMDGWIMDAALG
jgi:hypothetical protein